jgi:Glycosyl transferase family 90
MKPSPITLLYTTRYMLPYLTDYPRHLLPCHSSADINPASKDVTNCHQNDSTLISNYNDTPQPWGYGDRAIRSKMKGYFSIEQYMLSYRYLVVIGGISSADRLNTFLAHSGAVILLQETDFLYHFSAFLKPWVHYGESSVSLWIHHCGYLY